MTARSAPGLSVMLRDDKILLVRVGRREGVTRSGDVADEMDTEAAVELAADLVAAVVEIRRRNGK